MSHDKTVQPSLDDVTGQASPNQGNTPPATRCLAVEQKTDVYSAGDPTTTDLNPAWGLPTQSNESGSS